MPAVEIRIQGHLDPSWSEWLQGFFIIHTEEGDTTLSGQLKDQAALYGLIARLRDLGVTLLAVNLKDTTE
jgi:hypothetical protein